MTKDLIIFFAKYLIFAFPLFAGLSFLTLSGLKKKKMICLAFISGIILFALREISLRVFFNPRPFVINPKIQPLFPHAPDNGFPSDHTLLAMWLALLVFLYQKKLGFVLIIFSVLIGLARVLAFVHQPIDILGSLFLSTLAVCLSAVIMRKYYTSIIQKFVKNEKE